MSRKFTVVPRKKSAVHASCQPVRKIKSSSESYDDIREVISKLEDAIDYLGYAIDAHMDDKYYSLLNSMSSRIIKDKDKLVKLYYGDSIK